MEPKPPPASHGKPGHRRNGDGASRDGRRSPTVAVVGAGMSGLYMGYRLKSAGIDSFTIFEKGDSVGGAWRDNSYPGLFCDVPSRFYTYAFELNPDWTHFTAPGPELHRYFDSVARKYDLISHIEFGNEVISAEFDGRRWQVRTAAGQTNTFDFLVIATGVLHHPKVPAIPGLDTFRGALFHSARWDHSVELEGKRIVIVGTGSTGVQLVAALADVAGELVHIQRTPQWIFPLPNWSYSRFAHLLQRVPVIRRATFRFWRKLFGSIASRYMVQRGFWRTAITAACKAHLRLRVRDPALRRALTPDYQVGCKRIVMSTRFYPALQRPNVRVVIDGVERIVPEGVVTGGGTLHEADVVVLATGFHAQAYLRPMEVSGSHGLRLDEIWGDVPKAYQTIAMPGFPNFFMLSGPHNPLGNLPTTEAARIQTDYVVQWLELYRDGVFDLAAPTPEAMTAFNAAIEADYPNETVWASGCNSYYVGKDGLPSIWPWRAERYGEMLRRPRLADFEIRRFTGSVRATDRSG